MEELWYEVLLISFSASIVGIIILIIKQIFKSKLTPKWSYLIWMILIIKLILPYGPSSDFSIFNKIDSTTEIVNSLNDKYNTKKELPSQEGIISNITNETINGLDEINDSNKSTDIVKNQNTSTSSTVDNLSLLPYLWLSVGVSIVAISLISNIILKIKLKSNESASEEILQILESVKRKLDISKTINVLINKSVHTPALSGVVKPTIILPKNIDKLTEKELEYIFLHELGHYKRKDIYMNYIMILLLAIHWFNPIIWYCFSKIKEDIELATDEKVLSILNDDEHKDYAASIIKIVENVHMKIYQPTILTMANDKNKVKKRIINIKNNKLLKSKKKMFTTVGVMMGLTLGVTCLTSASDSLFSSFYDEESELENAYREVVRNFENIEYSLDDIKGMLKEYTLNEIGSELDTDFIYSFANESEELLFNFNNPERYYMTEGKSELMSISYINSNPKGYMESIYLGYSENYADSERLNMKIDTSSIINQDNILKAIESDIVDEPIYKDYYNLSKRAEEDFKVSKNELFELAPNLNDEPLEHFSGDLYTIKDGIYEVSISYDEDLEIIRRVSLLRYDTNLERTIIETNSQVGYQESMKASGSINMYIGDKSRHLEALDELKINKEESNSIKAERQLDINIVEDMRKKEKYFKIVELRNISYSSEVNPQEKTMEESIEYVKSHIGDNIVETKSDYEDGVGVTETYYDVGSDKYVVRYMHAMTDEWLEFDKDNTLGIAIYKDIFYSENE